MFSSDFSSDKANPGGEQGIVDSHPAEASPGTLESGFTSSLPFESQYPLTVYTPPVVPRDLASDSFHPPPLPSKSPRRYAQPPLSPDTEPEDGQNAHEGNLEETDDDDEPQDNHPHARGSRFPAMFRTEMSIPTPTASIEAWSPGLTPLHRPPSPPTVQANGSQETWYNTPDLAQVTLHSRNTGRLYEIIGPLSMTGTNKIVYARAPRGGGLVTIKCVHKTENYVGEGVGRVLCLREWSVMKGLTQARVPGVVRMRESWSDFESIYMVRDFYPWSLTSWMGYCDEFLFRRFALLLMFHLGIMHTHGIIHCNINPTSILVDVNGNPFYTSFRAAEKLPITRPFPYTKLDSQIGYLAPELVNAGDIEEIHQAADVWALGIVLLELYWGMQEKGVFRDPKKTTRDVENDILRTDIMALPEMEALRRRDGSLQRIWLGIRITWNVQRCFRLA
ncbi:kinase-like domain-containing protein [Irpex rosettiformis]|uniref:Kinase-like domain-containing protein n=1 Tax=Irpex rosettiformis TaxID=378272 RepID=A0ACB8TUZ0_9APHY|nr:kinase-like domain-containing protein [Irpex rosettiformis]